MTTHTVTLTNAQHIALCQAICGGAFAERQATLRTLIAHNSGTQIADSYERDLRDLLNAVDFIIHSQVEG